MFVYRSAAMRVAKIFEKYVVNRCELLITIIHKVCIIVYLIIWYVIHYLCAKYALLYSLQIFFFLPCGAASRCRP